MERQVDISFAHNGGSAVLLSSNTYDSHARWYDFATGTTTTQDPLAEKYHHLTPYLWCAANPITFTDPTGMAVFWHNGKVIGDDGIDD